MIGFDCPRAVTTAFSELLAHYRNRLLGPSVEPSPAKEVGGSDAPLAWRPSGGDWSSGVYSRALSSTPAAGSPAGTSSTDGVDRQKDSRATRGPWPSIGSALRPGRQNERITNPEYLWPLARFEELDAEPALNHDQEIDSG